MCIRDRRCLVLGAVDGNSVPHLILHNQHTELFELLAAVSYTHLDVYKRQTGGRVHIGKVSALKEKAFPISSFSGFLSLSPIRLSSISVPLLRML